MPAAAETYRLEVFGHGAWRTIPGYERCAPTDTNFISGCLNRATNNLVRAVRERDGKVFCGRVPEQTSLIGTSAKNGTDVEQAVVAR